MQYWFEYNMFLDFIYPQQIASLNAVMVNAFLRYGYVTAMTTVTVLRMSIASVTGGNSVAPMAGV